MRAELGHPFGGPGQVILLFFGGLLEMLPLLVTAAEQCLGLVERLGADLNCGRAKAAPGDVRPARGAAKTVRKPESSAFRQRSVKVRRLKYEVLAFGCIQLGGVSMKKS
jgi:hypothetical protein